MPTWLRLVIAAGCLALIAVLLHEIWSLTVGIVFGLSVVIALLQKIGRPSFWRAFGVKYALVRALMEQEKGNLDAAEALLVKAVARAETLTVERDMHLGTALSHLGDFYRIQGRFAEAEPILRQSNQYYEESAPTPSPYRGIGWHNLAALYITQGRYEEGEPCCHKALHLMEQATGPDSEYAAMVRQNLGQLYKGQGKFAEAEEVYQQARAAQGKARGRGDRMAAHCLLNLADLYRRQARYAEAEPLAREALAVIARARKPDVFALSRGLLVQAELARSQGRAEESTTLALRALALAEKHFGTQSPDVAAALHVLALQHKSQGNFAAAEPLFLRCLGIRNACLVPEHRDRIETIEAYADLLRKMNRNAEAAHWETVARETAVWAVTTAKVESGLRKRSESDGRSR